MPAPVPQKPKSFRSLTATIATAFLRLSVTVLIFAMALEVFLSFRTQTKTIEDHQTLVAQSAANQVSGYIQNVINVLAEAGNLTSLTAIEPKQQELVLSKLLGKNLSFRHVFVLNLHGEKLAGVSRVADTRGGYESLTPEARDQMIASIEKNGLFISSVRVDERTNEPLILIAVPVEDSLHAVQGVLVADVNLKFMWDLVSNIRVGDGGQAFVVDEKGSLIAYRDTSRVLNRENLQSLDEVQEFIDGEDRTGDVSELHQGIEGVSVVSTYVALGTPNWAVIVEMPVIEAYSSVILLLFESVGIIFLSAILAVVTAIYLSQRITKDIVELSKAADAISQGKLDTRISISSDNEIGQLAKSFNAMTEKVKESHTTLEKKVDERTGELDAKLKELEKINKLMIDRELKMVELKRELENLGGHTSP